MPIQPTPEQVSEFQDALRDEFRTAWQQLGTARPGDRFYGFGLYTGDDAMAMTVVAFSTLGLRQAAERYAARYHGEVALNERSLRWSPADSPLRGSDPDALVRSQALRNAMPHPFPDDADLDDGEFDDTAPDLVAKAVFRAAFAALKSLAKEGLFGKGAERESLTLGIWQYDESEKKKLAAVRKLNPESVVVRYQAEREDGMKASLAWQKVYIAAKLKERDAAKAKAAGSSAPRR